MPTKFFWISLLAVALSFTGGFFLANAFNRGELEVARREIDRLKAEKIENPSGSHDLTAEEIREKLAEADKNATNFAFQKNLGLALYRYSVLKQDREVLGEVIRILKRSYELNERDRDIQVGLGNAYFDTGYFNKDNASFEESRKFYRMALETQPSDVEVRTDLGLTYFLQEPPDLKATVAELERSIATHPKHEKTLQFLIQSMVKQNRFGDAAQYLERLKLANASNQAIPELSALINQSGEK